jgi:dUTP pyrophosphatase
MELKIKYVSDKIGAEIPAPSYATDGAAGMDLRNASGYDITIHPGERLSVPTGIAIELPNAEFGAFVFARSGLSSKKGISLSNGVGVIDSDYRGEILCTMVNLSDQDYTIQSGERIAQLVIMPVIRPVISVCEQLGETKRADGGFGSTGRV